MKRISPWNNWSSYPIVSIDHLKMKRHFSFVNRTFSFVSIELSLGSIVYWRNVSSQWQNWTKIDHRSMLIEKISLSNCFRLLDEISLSLSLTDIEWLSSRENVILWRRRFVPNDRRWFFSMKTKIFSLKMKKIVRWNDSLARQINWSIQMKRFKETILNPNERTNDMIDQLIKLIFPRNSSSRGEMDE